MAEHSAEELKRQWDAAKDRWHKAGRDVDDARRRYENALLEATGLAGHVVSGSRYGGGAKTVTILVTSIGGWKYDEYHGYVMKKDGTPGERTAQVKIEGAVDHGEYGAA